MSSYDEHRDALKGKVTFQGNRDEGTEHALASAYSGTLIPASHVGLINHFAFGSPESGGGGRYNTADKGIHSARNIASVMNWSPGARESSTFELSHETGHGVAHMMQPQQFESNMKTPHGRGFIEANADNYAHGAMPGSSYTSGYERQLARPQSPEERAYMNVDSYRSARR
jgi:hypothetical protein